MNTSSKTFLKTGSTAYLLTGIGHITGALMLGGGTARLKLKAHLNAYPFELFGKPYSLYQFHVGYSLTMATLFILMGALCLSINNPGKRTFRVLCAGSAIIAALVIYFFALLPQVLTCLAVLAFLLAYLKYDKQLIANKQPNIPAKF